LHAGIVNAAFAAQTAFPGERTDVLLGGYHVPGAAIEQRIPDTIRDLLDLVKPALFAPGRCSGWRRKTELASAAPERCAPSVVGARYDLAEVLTPRRRRGRERSA
jgi:7,8-dihydropterin-6-yl-methyl-4-(beta-D-ribofuranosyl)aminobenzene 5'-phosphate synthase